MITPIYKMKIIGYIKNCPSDRLSYPDMCKRLNGKDKVTYPEFLDFFLNLAISELNKDKCSLSFVNKIILTLTSFIEWNVERDFNVSIDVLNKVSGIRKLYLDYLSKIEEEHFQDLDDNLDKMDEKIKELFPDYVYDTNLEKEEKDSLVIYLEKELEIVRRKLEEYKKRVDDLEHELKGKESLITKKGKKTNKLNTELDKKKDKISELTRLLNEYTRRIDELSRECKDKEHTILDLSVQNNDLLKNEKELRLAIISLNKELKKLRKLLLEKEKVILSYKEVEEEILKKEEERIAIELKDKEIEEILIRRMVHGYSNTNELLIYMREVGYELSDDEFLRYFNKINISGIVDKLRSSRDDFVTPVSEVSDSIFNIQLNGNTLSYDILLVSDFHLDSFGKKEIEEMYLMYDYAVMNKIGLVVNAGDFFSFKPYDKFKGMNVDSLNRLIEQVILKYPKDNSIVNAILGGNHDKDAISYGIDPMNSLTQRKDFVNLGYGHATISFNDGELNGIGVHHPNRRYRDFITGNGYNSNEVVESLSSYYSNHSIVDKDTVYFDILGHIHKSSLDIENGICIAPSFRQDRFFNGAWHIKVYFDSNYNITEVVFIPLLKTNKLIPTTEIGYQKKLIK